MRLLLIVFALILLSNGYAENNSFEKSFQKFGQKLDKAKAKGEELGEDAKKEWKELKAKTEETAGEAKEQTKQKSQTWGARIKGAFTDFGAGVKNAWHTLKGDNDSSQRR